MDIGNKIKQLRTRQGLTLEELASRSELTKGFLSQLERDLTSPSIDSSATFSEALGTNLSEFFQEDKNDQFVFRSEDFFVDEAQRNSHRQLDRSQHAEKPDGAHFIGTSRRRQIVRGRAAQRRFSDVLGFGVTCSTSSVVAMTAFYLPANAASCAAANVPERYPQK